MDRIKPVEDEWKREKNNGCNCIGVGDEDIVAHRGRGSGSFEEDVDHHVPRLDGNHRRQRKDVIVEIHSRYPSSTPLCLWF
ncbi:hypothetical protein V6N13_028283 [Hibiscus sabdariffa]